MDKENGIIALITNQFDSLSKNINAVAASVAKQIESLVTKREHDAALEQIKELKNEVIVLQQWKSEQQLKEAQREGEQKIKSGFFSISKDIFLKLLPYAFTFTVGYLVHHWFF